jgi:hypothetical protein
MSKYLLIAIAALSLISTGTAQHKQQASVQRAVTPKHAGTFSPLSGFSSTTNHNRIGMELVLNNSILANYYSNVGTNQEWIDNNILLDTEGTNTEQVNGMEYIYCSLGANPNGLQETVTVYDDSVYCAGPSNWPTADCAYTISGLPGATNGALACWIITLDLAGVECNLTDGHGGSAGWGQIWDNADTGPWIAGGGLGQTDSFTWYDWTAPNANAFQGCFDFGGVPRAGFHMQMFSDYDGFYLGAIGSPGGAMTFITGGATPNGIVATAYAFGTGAHRVWNSVTGNRITTGLSTFRFTIADIQTADSLGQTSFSVTVPGAAAGVISVQSLDATTDGLSNVIDL